MCRSCERWNLTPIEERWEALEECEREFEGTRLRVSTDHIGLARLKSGLELVRIGRPMRPEFAAWRYGDQFGRRRRKKILLTAAGVAATGGLMAGQVVFGVVGGTFGLFNLANTLQAIYKARKTVATVNAGGQVFGLTAREIDSTQLIWAPERSEWSILIPKKKIWSLSPPPPRVVTSPEAELFLHSSKRTAEPVVELRGEDARHGLGKVMAHVNAGGGNKDAVQRGVKAIENAGDSDRFLRDAGERFAANREDRSVYKGGNLAALPTELRLALEMAANEENERNALLGELELLKEEWRAAEEIAAISDKLLVSREVQQNLQDLKDKDLQS